MNRAQRWVFILAALSLMNCGGGAASPPTPSPPPTLAFDCSAGPTCPEILINGDPAYTLPDGSNGPYRGLADPSLRKDPFTSRLWLSYSYVGLHIDPGPIVTQYVSTHLAHSDDNGASWQHSANLWESSPGTDLGASNDTGYSVHEVSTISPFTGSAGTEWFGLHLRYFLAQGDPVEQRKGDSFHFRLARAATPPAIGAGGVAILSNPLTAPGWGSDLNLSSLAPELSVCDAWSESALFQDSGKLYLIAECIALDLSANPPVRLFDQEFNAVFATDVGVDIANFDWQYLGKITTNASEAPVFGANVLTQVDIARARDGRLILIVTPTDENSGAPSHQGCRILEIASLNPPRLARNNDGTLRVRADIRSSDSESSGLCAYDPASSTGVILVRTHIDLSVPEVSWQMHATGIHP